MQLVDRVRQAVRQVTGRACGQPSCQLSQHCPRPPPHTHSGFQVPTCPRWPHAQDSNLGRDALATAHHLARLRPHRHKLFGRRGMDADGGIKLRLGGAALHRDGQALHDLRSVGAHPACAHARTPARTGPCSERVAAAGPAPGVRRLAAAQHAQGACARGLPLLVPAAAMRPPCRHHWRQPLPPPLAPRLTCGSPPRGQTLRAPAAS